MAIKACSFLRIATVEQPQLEYTHTQSAEVYRIPRAAIISTHMASTHHNNKEDNTGEDQSTLRKCKWQRECPRPHTCLDEDENG